MSLDTVSTARQPSRRVSALSAKRPEPANRVLRRAVLARLISDPLVHTGHIDLSVAEGVVTLSGYVTSIAQTDAARNAAARVKGVARVVNTLVVAVPCLPFDEFPLSLKPARHARAA